MSERAWPRDYEGPNWRSLRDAIVFVSRHFGSVRRMETKLYAALVSRDVLSVLERADGVRERLTCWGEIEFSITSYIDHPGELMRDDDIEIARGLQALDPNLIFVWWPDIERLCGLAEPPEPQPKPVKAKRPKRRRRRKKTHPEPVATEQPKPVEGEQPPSPRTKEPTTRHRMIIAILRAALDDDFTANDIAGKLALVHEHWEAECEARRVSYPLPVWKTVKSAIEDYLKRPSAYRSLADRSCRK